MSPHTLLGQIIDAATELAHESTRFQAVGFIDSTGNLQWEAGRRPKEECLIYVVRRGPAAPNAGSSTKE